MLNSGFRRLSVICLAIAAIIVINNKDAQAVTNKQCLKTQVEPQIIFQQNTAKTTINRSKTSDQITRFAKKISAYKRSKGKRLLGLAYTEMSSGMGVEVRGSRTGNRTCISLKKVKFSFSRVHSEIFVARKYKPGTCAYKVILAHEREHMKINDKVQAKYAKKIKKLVSSRANMVRPYITSKPKAAPKALINRLNNEIKPLVAQFNKERKRLNEKIDTPKSYAKVHSKCAKW
ncbi:hypothetical protein A9Q83_17590 [Alphaproteobacteria bacterium 46_93_T64]|nr:hypothetical protein A9Q83_17590 [Alphaproteobacteria bacterium 46_93_T64]